MSQTQISPPSNRPRMRRRVAAASALNSVSISSSCFAINIRVDKYNTDRVESIHLLSRIQGETTHVRRATGGSRAVRGHCDGRDEEVGHHELLRPVAVRLQRPDYFESVLGY